MSDENSVDDLVAKSRSDLLLYAFGRYGGMPAGIADDSMSSKQLYVLADSKDNKLARRPILAFAIKKANDEARPGYGSFEAMVSTYSNLPHTELVGMAASFTGPKIGTSDSETIKSIAASTIQVHTSDALFYSLWERAVLNALAYQLRDIGPFDKPGDKNSHGLTYEQAAHMRDLKEKGQTDPAPTNNSSPDTSTQPSDTSTSPPTTPETTSPPITDNPQPSAPVSYGPQDSSSPILQGVPDVFSNWDRPQWTDEVNHYTQFKYNGGSEQYRTAGNDLDLLNDNLYG